MRIPDKAADKQEWLKFVVDCCTGSQPERLDLYQKRRRYFLYGDNATSMVRFNRLKSHVGLVASFLYSEDGLAYSIAAPSNASDEQVKQYLAVEDEWNDEFRDCGLGSQCAEAILWGLIFDSMILKLGWNDRSGLFGELVEPASFGVFREDTSNFESQQAMTHSYLIDYDEACNRLRRAGKAADIERLTPVGEEGSNALPPVVTQLIISATGGSNLAGNIMGEVNPDYEGSPLYRPRLDAPLVRFHETWAFDEEATDEDGKACGDWRIFTSIEPDIILDDSKETISALRKVANEGGEKIAPKYDSSTNFFLKGDHPFTLFQPFQMYSYAWGAAHIEDLVPLQNWSNERLDQIQEILDRQADPPKSFTGFMSQDEAKMAAWGAPGSWVSDQVPGAKAEDHPPQMPEDLFAEFGEIGNLMLETSGLTEGIVGRGEKNVRGAGHHKELKITGGGRIRRIAVGLEGPLSRIGDIGLRLKAKNDPEKIRMDDGSEFVLSQLIGANKHTLRVAGHSHSPLFVSEQRELAAMLLKARSIDAEGFARMTNPPNLKNIIHSLRLRAKLEAQMRQQQANQPQPQPRGRPRAVQAGD